MRHSSIAGLVVCLLSLASCGYYFVAGPLTPSNVQMEEMTVADDGGVTFTLGRLDVRLRPITDEELNRQFQSASAMGTKSTNPYTFGDTEFADGPSPSRFTVFHLNVKNYAYPKIVIDPGRVEMVADNGRQYWSLDIQQLETFYRTYAIGYRGNEYARFQERLDILRRTMMKSDAIFSGQEKEGYILFPPLHDDVHSVDILIHDATLRFDFRGEPLEQIDISYSFERQVEKRYGGEPVEGA
jgi:hypothetical protein